MAKHNIISSTAFYTVTLGEGGATPDPPPPRELKASYIIHRQINYKLIQFQSELNVAHKHNVWKHSHCIYSSRAQATPVNLTI